MADATSEHNTLAASQLPSKQASFEEHSAASQHSAETPVEEGHAPPHQVAPEYYQPENEKAAVEEQQAATTPGGEEEDDDIVYPKDLEKALITVALALSVFCVALDNTILATAIPRITDQFHSINVCLRFLNHSKSQIADQFPGCRLVWIFVSAHHMRLPVELR